MTHHSHLSRRHILAALGSTAVIPGAGRAASHSTPESLTDEQITELENIITGIFGEEEPLPLGLTNTDNEDSSNDGLTINIGTILPPTTDDTDNESTETDTDETVVGCANAICQSTQLAVATDIGAVAEDVADIQSDFTRQTFRVQHLLHILTKRGIVSTLSPDDIAAIRENVRSATRYLPLIGSFNNVVETACLVDADPTEQNVIDFYLAVGAFCIEIAFFQFGVGYRIAFKGTNILATRTTVARLLQRTSPRIHALLLSEVHWGLREGTSRAAGVAASNSLRFVYNQTQEIQAEDPQHGIDGVEQNMAISYHDLASLNLFDCSQEESSDSILNLDWGSDDGSDTILDRAETIVQECQN
jgi:hypothetical protein